MSRTYYKATHPDGRDFATGTVLYEVGTETPPIEGELVICRRGYHVADTPAMTLVGGSWPCRLFRVEPIGEPGAGSWQGDHQHKGVYRSVRVIEELPAWQALGPNGEAVVKVIDRARTLTRDEADRMRAACYAARDSARGAAWDSARDSAWDSARDSARDAARGAARGATWGAAWGAAWGATWGAAWALVVRDLISAEHFETLVAPWVAAVGRTWEEA